ncbi:MAG TPA: 3-phosphoglycerate dehydrogenase [Bacteroidetes bacterium]|nr:3-phosphoglycerate dehydrogenase [Bacteroidota bacterium]HEX04314.1 3-phosphoglycerate dehydrogenase [Bacteroidota bacterium]
MAKILVNDGISEQGAQILRDAGHELQMTKVEQDDLINELKNYDAILVRSATKVRTEHIDASPGLKLVGRGGVGLDNIDVDYAKTKGIEIVNTPAASSDSVAELVLMHMFNLARWGHASNVTLRKGEWNKKKYKGVELSGRTLGIIGFGRIGQSLGRKAVALGMKVVAYDVVDVAVDYDATITKSMDEVLGAADFVSVHVPNKNFLEMTSEHFNKMKDGAYSINCARGGVLKEDDLLTALNSGKLAGAGLDCYDNEPKPNPDLLNHANVSATPHIGAATVDAQGRVGLELATKVSNFFAGKGAVA